MTDQEIKDLVAGLAIAQAKTDAIVKANALAQAKTDAQLAKTDAQLAKTDAQLAKTDILHKEMKAVVAETSRKVDILSQELGGVTKSQSMVAEEFFFNSLEAKPMIAGIKFDEVSRRMNKSRNGKNVEIDVFLENGASLALTEVKYRVRARDVEQVQKSITAFRELYPRYEHYKVYAGIAGFSFETEAIQKAHEQGLFVLKQVGDIIETDAGAMRAF